MIDRLVQHADVVSLKGASKRLKDRDLGRVPNDDPASPRPTGGGQFSPVGRGAGSTGVRKKLGESL